MVAIARIRSSTTVDSGAHWAEKGHLLVGIPNRVRKDILVGVK